MKKLLIAIVALLAGIAGIVATTPAQAANGVGAVIFSTDQDHGNIYEWDAATNAVTLVTNGSWPRLSPDGTRIAFHRVPSYKAFSGNNIASFDDVLVRNLATGSETRAVAVGDWTDAYNWVGNDHLVYDWGCGVLENGADGGPAVTLGGFDGGCYDDAPAYNAATGTLYFAESPGSPYLDPGIYSGTPYYAATQLFKLQTPVFQWPSLSPDGSRLLFACGPTSLCAGSSPSFPQIGTIGSGPETIQGYPSSIAAAWTPDGSAAVGAGPDNSLRLFPADGSNTTGTVLATIDPALYGTIDWVGGVLPATTTQPSNTPPHCGNYTGSVAAGGTLADSVACSDSDSGDRVAQYELVPGSGPYNGLLTFDSTNGSFTYAPNSGFSGSDTFRFRALDSYGAASADATATVTVSAPPNRAPVCSAYTGFVITEDTLSDHFDCSDPDGDPLQITIVSQPQFGPIATGTGNAFTYTPGPHQVGNDYFTFKATDTHGADSNTANGDILVHNHPTTCSNYTGTVAGGATLHGQLSCTNPDTAWMPGSVRYALSGNRPQHGTLTANFTNGSFDGNFTYTPDPGYSGTDSFNFVGGGFGYATSNLGTATITVTAADVTPPTVVCVLGDAAWHDHNVSLGCSANDWESGLANPADASFSLSTSVPAGSETANAATDSRKVCDNAGNCATAGPIGGNKIDRAAPVLHLPGSLVVNATGPTGATVTYSVSATDGADPSPSITCSPASGSTFAIGATTVTCNARDHVGNIRTDGFTVSVVGAKDQLSALIQKVVNSTALPTNAKTQLIGSLQALVANFNPANAAQKQLVCGALKVFVAAVQAMSGKTIPAAVAADWIADANRIRAVLGCP